MVLWRHIDKDTAGGAVANLSLWRNARSAGRGSTAAISAGNWPTAIDSGQPDNDGCTNSERTRRDPDAGQPDPSSPVSFDAMPVNWGSIADWAAAGGAVIASITALSIASRDRGERKRERDDAGLAQARLVLITVETPAGPGGYPVRVENFGDRPVMNIDFETATIDGLPQAQVVPSTEWHEPDALLQPGCAPKTFFVAFVKERDEPTMGAAVTDAHGNLRYPLAPEAARVRATVRYTDASGVQWVRTAGDTPRRVLP